MLCDSGERVEFLYFWNKGKMSDKIPNPEYSTLVIRFPKDQNESPFFNLAMSGLFKWDDQQKFEMVGISMGNKHAELEAEVERLTILLINEGLDEIDINPPEGEEYYYEENEDDET